MRKAGDPGGELEEFSCLYWWARCAHREALQAKPVQAEAVEGSCSRSCPGCITRYPTCISIGKRTFSRRSRSMSRTTLPCCRSWTPAAPGTRRAGGCCRMRRRDAGRHSCRPYARRTRAFGAGARGTMCFSTRRSRWPFSSRRCCASCSWRPVEPLHAAADAVARALAEAAVEAGRYDTLAGGFVRSSASASSTRRRAHPEGKPDCAELTAFAPSATAGCGAAGRSRAHRGELCRRTPSIAAAWNTATMLRRAMPRSGAAGSASCYGAAARRDGAAL